MQQAELWDILEKLEEKTYGVWKLNRFSTEPILQEKIADFYNLQAAIQFIDFMTTVQIEPIAIVNKHMEIIYPQPEQL